jgi:hypothetical protein
MHHVCATGRGRDGGGADGDARKCGSARRLRASGFERRRAAPALADGASSCRPLVDAKDRPESWLRLDRLERPEAALMSDATDKGDAGEAKSLRRLRRLYRTPGTSAWASSLAVASMVASMASSMVPEARLVISGVP